MQIHVQSHITNPVQLKWFQTLVMKCLTLNLLRGLYIHSKFLPLQGTRETAFVTVCFPAHEAASEKGSVLKGKNLVLLRANSSLLE